MATPEEIAAATQKAAADAAAALLNLQTVFGPVAETARQEFDKIIKKANETGKSFSDFASTSIQTGDEMSSKLLAIGKAFNFAFTMMSPPLDAFKTFKVEGGAAVNTMGDQFEKLTTQMGSWGAVTEKLMGSVPMSILRAGESIVKRYLEHAAAVEHLESSYLDMQAATGKLGSSFGETGLDAGKLNDAVAQFSARLIDAAGATGQSIDDVSRWAGALGEIPDVFNSVISATDKQGKQLDALTGALTLASGAHRDVKEVISAMTMAYEDLGQAQGKITDGTDRGARLFAMMAETSQKLGLRFKDTQGYLATMAGTFKMLGDNTEGSAKILARFSSALQNTGLTAKQSVDVIQHMVGQMSQLEIGTKALVSARTGGPGGLQGAFQIDQLLRSGQVDKVASMMEKTLRQQFGGRIYSQEEAARSPQAAAGFFRQQQMLRSGAFGGLAKDDASATHILEALKQGPAATAEVLRSSQEAVSESLDKGEAVQERSYNVLTRINNSMDRGVAIQEQQFMLQARDLLGIEGAKGAGDFLSSYKNQQIDAGQTEALQMPRSMQTMRDEGITQAMGGVIGGVSGEFKTFYDKMQSGLKQTSEDLHKATAPTNREDANKTQKMGNEQNLAVQHMQASRRGNARAAALFNQDMQTSLRPELGAQIPRAMQTVKHEIDLKGRLPIDLTVDIKTPPGYQGEVSTSNPNVVISSAAKTGGVNYTQKETK